MKAMVYPPTGVTVLVADEKAAAYRGKGFKPVRKAPARKSKEG